MPLDILGNAVDIIAGQTSAVFFGFSDDRKVIAIINVETITGGNPNESIWILEHLSGKVARKLVVWIEKFSSLRHQVLRSENEDKHQ